MTQNEELPAQSYRADGILLNTLTKMGTHQDKSEHTRIGYSERITKPELERLYKNAICQRVCTARPYSAVKKGWELTLGGDKTDPNLLRNFNEYHKKLGVPNAFSLAQTWANLYRGAAVIMIIDDGQDADKPVIPEKIKSIKKLEILSCHQVRPYLMGEWNARNPTYYQLMLPNFNLGNQQQIVEYNRFYNGKGQYLIHSDRVLRFDGVIYPDDMLLQYDGWGGSVLEVIWEDFRDWKAGLKAAGNMLNDFSLFVYAIKGLRAIIESNDENFLQARLQMIRMMTSVFGGLAIDADGERVEMPTRNFGGVDSVIDKLRDAFIGATGIPHDKLFGESPSGLGATGESEEKNWAHDIEAFQIAHWLPPLERLFKYIFAAKDGPSKGKEPESWGIRFIPLIQESPQDVATLRSTQAQTDNTYITAGILLPEEIRQSRFGGAEYSIETVLDKKLWEENKKKQEEEAAGFGDFGAFGAEGAAPPAEEDPLAPTEETEPTLDSVRTDSQHPLRQIVNWQGIQIGLTHRKNELRYGRPMRAGYGHVRRSYGDAPDGKAIDVYVGENLESPNLFKVRQIDPDSGFPDEEKYFIGYDSPQQVRDTFCYHAGRDRFGGIESCDVSELSAYRQDACSCPTDRLRSGVKVLNPSQRDSLIRLPTNPELAPGVLLEILQSGFPEEILGINHWDYQDDAVLGEFDSPYGTYGFKMQKGYWGYGWKRDHRQDAIAIPKKKQNLILEPPDHVIDKTINATADIFDQWIDGVDSIVQQGQSYQEILAAIGKGKNYQKLENPKFPSVLQQANSLSFLLGVKDIIDGQELQ